MLNLRPKAARDDEPDLTPLIDMVFILLIFFILAASSRCGASTSTCLRRTAGRRFPGAWWKSGCSGTARSCARAYPWPAPTSARSCKASCGTSGRAPDSLCSRLRPTRRLVFIVDEVRMQGGEKLLIATAQPDEPGRP